MALNKEKIKELVCAYHKGSAQAERELSKIILKNDPAECYELAIIYLSGMPEAGVTPDLTKAIGLLKRAAEKKYILAEYFLGKIYLSGMPEAGVTPDLTKAIGLLKGAAEKKYPPAEYWLGKIYLGVTKADVTPDVQQGILLLKRAAEKKYPPAEYLLARLHMSGHEVNSTYDTSISSDLFNSFQSNPKFRDEYELISSYFSNTWLSNITRISKDPNVIKPSSTHLDFIGLKIGLCDGLTSMYIQSFLDPHHDGLDKFNRRLSLMSNSNWTVQGHPYSDKNRDFMIFIENVIFFQGDIENVEEHFPIQKKSMLFMPESYYAEGWGKTQGLVLLYNQTLFVNTQEDIESWLQCLEKGINLLTKPHFKCGVRIDAQCHTVGCTFEKLSDGTFRYTFFDQGKLACYVSSLKTLSFLIWEAYLSTLGSLEKQYLLFQIYASPLEVKEHWGSTGTTFNSYFNYEHNILMQYFTQRYDISTFIRTHVPSTLQVEMFEVRAQLHDKLSEMKIHNQYSPIDPLVAFRAKELILDFLYGLIDCFDKDMSIAKKCHFIKSMSQLDMHTQLLLTSDGNSFYKEHMRSRLDFTEVRTYHGESILKGAVARNQHYFVRCLLKTRAIDDIHARSTEGLCAFFSNCNNVDIAELLIKKTKAIDSTSGINLGMTLLIFACIKGHFEIVRLLLSHGADVNYASLEGVTALMYASKAGYLEIVELLLSRGANANYANPQGGTALMYASIKGDFKMVGLLLSHGANANYANPQGITVLRHFSIKGHLGMVGLLLSHGAKVDHASPQGNTALMYASEVGYLEIVELLLSHGANVNHASFQGGAALIYPTDIKMRNLNRRMSESYQ
jgi:ankyrin repeat protein